MTTESTDLSKRAPAYLGRIAASMWRTLVPVLNASNSAKRSDQKLVESYCATYEIYRHSYEHIKKHGEVTEIWNTPITPKGEVLPRELAGYKRNPSTLIYSDAVTKLAKLGAELGLSPRSRAELEEMVPPEPVEPESVKHSLTQFFAGGDKS